MPGCARRVRPAYSRTLCLPCLKAGIFCFLHYRYHCLYVQLFIFNFLCICLLLFGTSFFSRSSFKSVLPVAFTCAVQTSTGASRRANRGCLRLGWCCFPTPPSNRPRIVAQGRVLFSPQNELTPPPKGGGAGFCSSLGFRVLLGSCLWQPLATTGSHGPNRAGLLLQWRRSPTRLS